MEERASTPGPQGSFEGSGHGGNGGKRRRGSVLHVQLPPLPVESAYPSSGLKSASRAQGGAAGRRKEQGWSGEWNRMDMGEVMDGLRGLKGK